MIYGSCAYMCPGWCHIETGERDRGDVTDRESKNIASHYTGKRRRKRKTEKERERERGRAWEINLIMLLFCRIPVSRNTWISVDIQIKPMIECPSIYFMQILRHSIEMYKNTKIRKKSKMPMS